MTILPTPDRNVKGRSDIPRYQVHGWCAHPRCGRPADHVHHLWRRSAIGGDHAWVELSDGSVWPNLVGLCYQHHDEVTVNRASILLQMGRFYWVGEQLQAVLEPHPPAADMQQTINGDEELHANVVGHEEATCPTCKRRLPKPKAEAELEPGAKRPKKSWALTVPVDERENGVEIIDSLMETARDILDRGEHKSWRYYTLVEVLHDFVSTNAR